MDNKRNVAIIAHVDHGKTTILNEILKESVKTEHIDKSTINVDSNKLEQERGITILSKPTGITYKNHQITIVDTPGHADFGGEVERIMNMVDGVILVVDSYEGVMPQTRFVLKKAIEANLKPIVVINKMDKAEHREQEVLEEIIELFMDLNATDDQLDFKVLYASGVKGVCSLESDFNTMNKGLSLLLDLIISEIKPPQGELDKPFLFQPSLLDYNDYVGRIGVGVIKNGKVKEGEIVKVLRYDGKKEEFRVLKIFKYSLLNQIEVKEAEAGDVIAIAGLSDINVGETIGKGDFEALPLIKLDSPTIKITIAVNSSPFLGQDGNLLTARMIKDRLLKEQEKDVALKVEQLDSNSFLVSGRGELHLGILIENMRREGFEMEVSKPQVIYKEEDGKILEPFEILSMECPNDSVGTIIEKLGTRGATLTKMNAKLEYTDLEYLIPSRGLMGFTNNFLSYTKGYGIISHRFEKYLPKLNLNLGERVNGVMISLNSGKATAYDMQGLEERGIMFVEPGTDVYEGMIVGEHNSNNDLVVNVTKGKALTNMRAAGSDHTVILKKKRAITLEYSLDYINSDELVEVTPKNIRLRKKYLTELERRRHRS